MDAAISAHDADDSHPLELFHSQTDSKHAREAPPKHRGMPRTKSWDVTKIVIRAFSTLHTVGLIGIVIVAVVSNHGAMYPVDGLTYLCLPSTVLCLLWDTAEYITLCARRGRGIPAKAHVGVESVLFLATASCTVSGAVLYTSRVTTYIDVWRAATVFLAVIAISHFIMLIGAVEARLTAVRKRRDIRRRASPRYDGEAPRSADRPAEELALPPHSHRVSQTPGPLELPVSGIIDASTLFLLVSLEDESRTRSLPGESSPSIGGDNQRESPCSTTDIEPPSTAQDHEPDDATQSRRRRGEAQPQFINPAEYAQKFTTSGPGITPADAGTMKVLTTDFPRF